MGRAGTHSLLPHSLQEGLKPAAPQPLRVPTPPCPDVTVCPDPATSCDAAVCPDATACPSAQQDSQTGGVGRSAFEQLELNPGMVFPTWGV